MSAVDRDGIKHGNRSIVKQFLLLAVLLIFLLSGGHASAIQTDKVIESQADALELDILQQAAQEYSPDINWTQTPDLNKGLADLFERSAGSYTGVLKKAIRSGVLLLVIVLLTGLADSTNETVGQKIRFAVPVAAALAITAVAVADANTLIGLGNEVIEKMEQFSKVLLPTVTAITAASGSPGTAAARQVAVMLFSDVLVTLINRILLPLVYTYITAYAAHAAIGNEGLKRIATTLKWIITLILTSVMLAFVGYLTVSGVIAKTTDVVALKATKFTMSTVVPVVGGILSDAAETVLAGAGILKSTVGVFGMLTVLGMCVIPFLQLGIHYLVYKITAALSATIADSRTAGLIDGISGAFGLVLGMTGASAMLLLVSLVSAVSVVNT